MTYFTHRQNSTLGYPLLIEEALICERCYLLLFIGHLWAVLVSSQFSWFHSTIEGNFRVVGLFLSALNFDVILNNLSNQTTFLQSWLIENRERNESMESRNRPCIAGVSKLGCCEPSPTAIASSTKGRSHSLTTVPPLPSVCITPSPEEAAGVGGLGVSSSKQLGLPLSNAAKPRPRLSIPHIFSHHSSGTSPLTSTPSISSLLTETAAAAARFSFSIPQSMRRGSWSVSLSSGRTKIAAWASRSLALSPLYIYSWSWKRRWPTPENCIMSCSRMMPQPSYYY